MEQDGEQVVEEEQVMVEYEEAENYEEVEDENNENFHWTPIAVNLLLNLRFQRNKEFDQSYSHYGNKSEIWEEISKEMKKNGFNTSSYMCNEKYEDLLKTYRTNKEKREMGLNSTSFWIHYDLMDAYLGDNKNNEHHPSTSSNSLYSLIQDTVEDGNQSDHQKNNGKEGTLWVCEAVILLLRLRFEKHDLFMDPQTKKINMWDDIAEALRNEGHNVSGHHCDTKFRNLLSTYRTCKKRIGDGEKFVRWRYFESFDPFYKHEFESTYKNINKIPRSSYANTSRNGFASRHQEEDDDEDDDEDDFSPKKKTKMNINKYLMFKIKAEEKKRKDYMALEEKKLKLEYKKLEIEQKKIDVFKSLVAAVKQGNKIANKESTSS